MSGPAIDVRRIGREAQPLIVVDGFAADPDALRAAAIATRFGAAAHYYPGIRAPLPAEYLRDQLPVIAALVNEVFGRSGGIEVIDASFSIVTRAPAALTLKQRLPHCDSYMAGRIALLHYLVPEGGDGTAFFRHRATGFETIDEARAPEYDARLAAELRAGAARPAGYIAGDTQLFERIAQAEARYNRALLYPSFLLHSGAIAAGAVLSPDPERGRLTVTGFLAVG